MSAEKNRQIRLASRPEGEPRPENFKLVETEIPKAGFDQMLLQTIYLSLDPYMRGRMSAAPSYAAPVEVGGVMEGRAVCEVVRSNIPHFRGGDIVVATTGWQDYLLSDATGVQKVDPALAPISYFIGVLGMPGLTAYTGLLNIGRPQSGETLVVAAASGAVGSVVGQIGKIKGCRVIGIAAGDRCKLMHRCQYRPNHDYWEPRASWGVTSIVRMELDYHQRHQRYASMDELHIIPTNYEAERHDWKLVASRDHFQLWATSVRQASFDCCAVHCGHPAFFADETQIIRVSTNCTPASARSIPLYRVEEAQ